MYKIQLSRNWDRNLNHRQIRGWGHHRSGGRGRLRSRGRGRGRGRLRSRGRGRLRSRGRGRLRSRGRGRCRQEKGSSESRNKQHLHGNMSSFNDLPYRLKHCFLYCSIFPEDYLIRAERLIRLWIAEGFVEHVKGVTLEEVSESYLMELNFRSMLQVVRCPTIRQACKMHDLMRELALSALEKEKFCVVYDGREVMEEIRARRLSIQTSEGEIKMKLLRYLYLLVTREEEFLRIDAFASLPGPPPHLQRLLLSGKLATVPSWFSSLRSLTDISLHLLKMYYHRLILVNAYVGNELCFNIGFAWLTHLELLNFPCLKNITIEEGVMPKLQLLILHCCMKLKALPHGLEFLRNLETLRLGSVPMKMIENIREGGVDHPKVQHIREIDQIYETSSATSSAR
ncbi:hypothetical protein PRUPE_8G008600 [Prunus persica]|uniref:Disease resistance protein winged helix domain-containing protein n=1 Tax=Prunus persica TaxID=3760 RepID=A0A251MQU8_PRUPE|nr:hypothetical protein PRUPE_8G008600 [Prunus persica]